ncbi:MAG: phage tail protein [Bacteroidia bacterium]|nr:phage tail protein [Bacteroidia bacterium]
MANYPIPKFRFLVEFETDGGPVKAGFTEVSGLDNETDIIEYREGSDDTKYKRIILGLSKPSRITMKRGIFNDDSKLQFYEWWSKTLDKQKTESAQKDVTIKLLDEEAEPVIVWKLNKAIAVKLQSTDLKSDGNEIAIESLELAHEGLTIQS